MKSARKIAAERQDFNCAGFCAGGSYILVMKRELIFAVIALALASPAWAQGPTSFEAPPLETIDNAAPKAEPMKTFVPGHKSKYGGWVRPYTHEGGAVPLPPPGEKSQGYMPGHHDADGAWVPGHPQ